MSNTIDLIEDIISRPSTQYYNVYMGFNSRTLQANWNNIIGNQHYYTQENFNGPFFKHFWKVVKHLSGRNADFRVFTEHWFNLCKDHSSRDPKIEICDRINLNLPTRYGHLPTTLKNCTRLYYIASGINNIPTTPNDQDDTISDSPHIYKAEESHTLQKILIKLRSGDSITTKIYKEKVTEARIIYFNKFDSLAVAYLQVYAFTKSWFNFIAGNIEHEPIEISNILRTYKTMLEQTISAETYSSPLKDDPHTREILAQLTKIEEKLLKINQSDNTLEDFANNWQKKLAEVEKKQAEKDVESLHANAKKAMDDYYRFMENVRTKQKFLRSILMNEEDTKFLLDYFNLFKTLPNTLFHRKDSEHLYCLYEVPFAQTDFAAMKKSIKDIPTNMTPTYQPNWNNSIFAAGIWWAISANNSSNENYWKKPLISGYEAEKYWPAFMKAAQRFLNEIFVERKIAMFMSACLMWQNGTTNYQPYACNVGSFPAPFQPFIKERIWQPHMTHYNCWGAAQGEITKALSNRDAQTAFEYTVSATGQISVPDVAGVKIASHIWGDNKGYYASSCKIAAENLRIYLREGQKTRETLREILTLYITEELVGVEPIPIIIPKTEIKPKPGPSLTEQLIWLENYHFIPEPGQQMTQIASTEDTRFLIGDTVFIFLPSGDFLTLENYGIYCEKFPNSPQSIPSAETQGLTSTYAAPTENPINEIDEETLAALIRGSGPRFATNEPTQEYIIRNENTHIRIPFTAVHTLPRDLRRMLELYADGRLMTGDNFDIDTIELDTAPNYTEAVLQELRGLMHTHPAEPTEPTPAPLQYIDLIRTVSGWRFPNTEDLPNEFRQFNQHYPAFGGTLEPTNTVQYDIVEDTLSFEANGVRHIIATNVSRRLP